ncbi:MAG: M28 family peptidase [Dokdonella sp.]
MNRLPLAGALCVALMGAAQPQAHDQGLLVDIRHATGADIESMKQTAGVDWWLELGDRLLLVGDRATVSRHAAQSLRGVALDSIASERLALHARGCADHATTIGSVIAEAGRWEVRQLGAGVVMPESDEWQSVSQDSVLARRYRPDEFPRPPADTFTQSVVDAVDPARWFADVTTLAGWDRHSKNTAQLTLARNWVGAQFSSLGLTVTTPPFTAGGFTASNVIGTWTGTVLPAEWIIVGGHYDSRNASSGSTGSSITNTPGAEDNASGCAGVVELARVIVATQPERSVLFMCYAGEEQGLYGSKAHVTALQASGDIGKVKHAMIMDMIGYSATADIEVLLESNIAQQAIITTYEQAATTYVPELGLMTATNANGSDHVPYLNAGRSSLLTIENDWNIYPNYHRSTDTPANMGSHAQAMGGAILRMNAAVLVGLTRRADPVFADGFDSLAP